MWIAVSQISRDVQGLHENIVNITLSVLYTEENLCETSFIISEINCLVNSLVTCIQS